MCLFANRLERGRFLWPAAKNGSVRLSAAGLSVLLEGIDWRNVERRWLHAFHPPHLRIHVRDVWLMQASATTASPPSCASGDKNRVAL